MAHTATPVLGPHVLHGVIQAPFEVRPDSVPLEVGYSPPNRTFAHLFTEGAVARWPYNDDEAHLLVELERAGLVHGHAPAPGRCGAGEGAVTRLGGSRQSGRTGRRRS